MKAMLACICVLMAYATTVTGELRILDYAGSDIDTQYYDLVWGSAGAEVTILNHYPGNTVWQVVGNAGEDIAEIDVAVADDGDVQTQIILRVTSNGGNGIDNGIL